MLLQPLPTSQPGSQLPENKSRLHPSEAAAVCSLEGVRNLDGGNPEHPHSRLETPPHLSISSILTLPSTFPVTFSFSIS